MSTNYNILLRSEKQLKKLIIEYLDLTQKIHTKFWKELNETDKENYGIILDNTERRIKQAFLMEEELIDECIWTISKDGPRANHLRFIVSIIYCAKDLTRACEYSQSIIKIIMRRNIDKNNLKPIQPIVTSYLDLIAKIIKIYSSNHEDKIEKVDEITLEFETKLDEYETKLREEFKNDPNQITYLYVSQIIRFINSTIERIKSVFPSTLFIKSNTTVINSDKKEKK